MNCSLRLLINSFAVRAAAFVLLATSAVSAQSIDPNVPTPIRSHTLTGKIAARDLGDARLTDHYYLFRGTPGDLLITVQSTNLNGDIDVFTAGTLRPLLKLTLYAESTSPVTKGIYLRRSEDLILRVEGRTPNDDEGSYQFHFGGSFQAVEGGPDIAENENPTTPSPTDVAVTGRKTKRVSSVGARLPEPPTPATEVATATPSPEPTPEPTPAESPSPGPTTEKPTTAPARPSPRSARNRRPTTRRTTATKPKEAPAEEAKNEEPGETPAEPKPKAPARTTSRRTTARATQPEPQAEPEEETGPRLVIETNDGTLINRSMMTVKRVTVENGQVVVIGKDGKIDRIRLANVVRMQIQ